MVIEQIGPSRQIPTKYGQRNVYSVKFKENENWADVIQKPELPPPTVGQQMEGTIEKTNYGYSFRRTQTSFGGSMRTQGYSNRQVALQCAARFSKDIESCIQAAETCLKWLDADVASQVTPAQNANTPPASNYEDLGI